jgi:hypothetical protein
MQFFTGVMAPVGEEEKGFSLRVGFMSSKRIILCHQKDNSPPTGKDGLGLSSDGTL